MINEFYGVPNEHAAVLDHGDARLWMKRVTWVRAVLRDRWPARGDEFATFSPMGFTALVYLEPVPPAPPF